MPDSAQASTWLALLLGPYGLLVALLLFILGLYAEWWVMGKPYRRLLAERDEALRKADENDHLVERMLNVVEKRGDRARG